MIFTNLNLILIGLIESWLDSLCIPMTDCIPLCLSRVFEEQVWNNVRKEWEWWGGGGGGHIPLKCVTGDIYPFNSYKDPTFNTHLQVQGEGQRGNSSPLFLRLFFILFIFFFFLNYYCSPIFSSVTPFQTPGPVPDTTSPQSFTRSGQWCCTGRRLCDVSLETLTVCVIIFPCSFPARE